MPPLPTQAEYLATSVLPLTVIPQRPVADTECSICCEKLSIDPLSTDVVMLTPCNHFFHAVCVCQWITSTNQQRGTCPVCRASLFQPDALSAIPAASPRLMQRSSHPFGGLRSDAHPDLASRLENLRERHANRTASYDSTLFASPFLSPIEVGHHELLAQAPRRHGSTNGNVSSELQQVQQLFARLHESHREMLDTMSLLVDHQPRGGIMSDTVRPPRQSRPTRDRGTDPRPPPPEDRRSMNGNSRVREAVQLPSLRSLRDAEDAQLDAFYERAQRGREERLRRRFG